MNRIQAQSDRSLVGRPFQPEARVDFREVEQARLREFEQMRDARYGFVQIADGLGLSPVVQVCRRMERARRIQEVNEGWYHHTGLKKRHQKSGARKKV